MSISEDSEDEEEIRKRLYADFDQVSINDTNTEKSFIFEHKQYEYHDFTKSKTWLEFMNQNKEREEMLDKMEDNIQLMKKINQGNQFIQVEDDNGEVLQVQVQEQLENEVITEIKEKQQPNVVCHEEQIVQHEELSKSTSSQKQTQQIIPPTPKKPSRFVSKQHKVEQITQEREMLQMEREDTLSRQNQEDWLKQLFKNRLFTLPEEFPNIKPIPTKTLNLQFEIPIIKFQNIEIPLIQTLDEENLAPNNTKELVFTRLSNIKFEKMKFVEHTIEKKSKQESSQKIVIDTDLKYNIVYQDFLKKQAKLTLSDSVEDIYWKKVNNLHQELMNIIAKTFTKIPKYISYRQPFTEFEQPSMENMGTDIQEGNQFTQYIQSNQVSLKARKLEIKLENLTTLEGIQKMKEVRQLILSSNNINNITQLSALSNVIEVDLQQNKITSYSSLGQLSNLRTLHLEMNQIQEMSRLENCKFLEVYSLKGNQIQKITNLDNLIFLKQLHLFKNQLKTVQNLENCLILEILDLSSNQIEIKMNENPFRNNQCLRRLILTKNKIQNMPEMRLLLLNELYINKNKLESLDGLIFLPSLQILQVQDNCLQTCYDTEYQVSYLPNVQQIDISGNRIQSFGTIISFIQRCSELKQINYIENPFLFGLSEDVLQLYRYLLIINCKQLIEVNSSLLNKKDQEFLQEKFTGFLDPLQSNKVTDLQGNFKKMISSINKNTQIMHRINGLEQRKLTKNHPFSYTEKYKSIQILNDCNFIKSNFVVQVDIEKEIDNFLIHYQKSVLKVKNVLIRWIYKFKKRQKHYLSKIPQIVKIQALIRGHFARSLPEVVAFQQKHNKKKFILSAIKIQKVWRGYIIRKRLRIRMKNVKFVDDELDEIGEIDDFLNQDLDMNFDIRIPQGIDLQQLFKQTQSQQQLLQQQMQQQAQEKVKQQIHQKQQEQFKTTKKPSGNTETQMRTSHLSGTQMGSSKYSEKSNKTDQLPTIGQRTQKIMDNWNFKDPAVAYTIACKLQKEQKRKNKKKELTPQEKIERFRLLANKH